MGGLRNPYRHRLMRWMHLSFRAPLAAFGGEAIDARGVTRDFPSQSMLTGLLANALGWSRAMRQEHQRLQSRIVYGAVREHEPVLGRMTDYQTAQLAKDDRAWTTRGVPAKRDGGAATYDGAHQRWRDYHADLRMSVVLRLAPDDQVPTLDDLETALVRPARPLFIGRKPCLPAVRIFQGWVDAEDARSALRAVARCSERTARALWPASDGEAGADLVTDVTDERNWLTGLHGGARRVCEGRITPADAGG